MLSGRILLELRDSVQDTSDGAVIRGRDGVSKVSTMDFAPRDQKNRRRVPDGLSFDADAGDARSMSDMFGEEDGSGTETRLGSGTADYTRSGGDIESGSRIKNVPSKHGDQVC